jgi:DNA repair protein SbcD/Mre11
MSLRIFLTSDLHIGMKFAEYPTAHAELVEERFQCLARMVAEAGARRCDLLVVAGDLFHRVSVSRRDVQRAAELIRDFSGTCVAVLPGNHDFYSSDDELWPRFREKAGDSVLFLDEQRPYPLLDHEVDACLYPGPCLSIHSATSAVGWVQGAQKDAAIRHHIGIAHGSLEGVSPDFKESYFPMKVSELLVSGVDAWLLGHTHVRFPERPTGQDKIFFPGTPAPDGFDCAHEGSAWLLEMGDDREVSAQPLTTGALRFVDRMVDVRGGEDLKTLEMEYAGVEARRTLLKLRLSGRVTREVLSEIGPLRARLAERLLSVELRTEDLREEITRAAIDAEYPAGSFPHSLLSHLAEAGEHEALRIAHELLEELLP